MGMAHSIGVSWSTQQKLLIFALVLLTFVTGTSEFVIVGLLSEVASDLEITISAAGALVSGFAFAVAIGTPIVTVLVSRYPAYSLMLTFMVIFIAGNITSALSSTYPLLMGARVITAVACGLMQTIAMTVASETMPAEKKGTVVSLVFAGFTIASVLGVPLGTWIGQAGGWNMAFWFTACLGIVSFVMLAITLPRNLKGTQSSLKNQIGLFTHSPMILAFFVPALSIAATYVVYTYITPILENVLLIPAKYTSLILLLYGTFSIISTLLAGKIAARNGLRNLRFVFVIQAVILASLYFTLHSAVPGFINILFVGLAVYLFNVTFQLYLIDLAGEYSPSAKVFAASLFPVSVNLGIAAGAGIGGLISTHIGLLHTGWAGGVLALAASLLTFTSYRLYQTK
ncbi:Predicted arabinose efflux permease, MFS family [Paenibacillus tianmuensis]|uniref:Predicted arabinose efflux permease, MFS family n=1 Tax=Paenibacillus tianmuensis TaxID=624147 RepID=A0A1G4PLQ8_9BACL|nr:MFS transporter [Paenibacillus tianmuensis]SCW33018.1 Predicted arabinose efflux permease, MFS family [Paenibacillus tianmuensis]